MFKRTTPLTALAVFLIANTPAGAAALLPYQQAALDQILATMDPQTQALARPQLEQTLSVLGESQVQMLLSSMTSDSSAGDADAEEDAGDTVATPDDLEFNRGQYEPAIRDAWQANKAFDEAVEASLARHCPTRDEYAVYGMGWRYEVAPMQPNWTRSSQSAEVDVQVVGAAYAPQDGRYEFDFSAVRNTFDPAAVDQAVASACVQYRVIGEEFMADARPRVSNDDLPGGDALQGAANGKTYALIQWLEAELLALAPSGSAGVLTALVNGRRVGGST
jgi:hypothetical protein